MNVILRYSEGSRGRTPRAARDPSEYLRMTLVLKIRRSFMSTIAVTPIPVSSAKRRVPWLLAVFIALGVVGIAWLVMALSGRGGDGYAAGEFFTVKPIDLDVTITKDGELQAVK